MLFLHFTTKTWLTDLSQVCRLTGRKQLPGCRRSTTPGHNRHRSLTLSTYTWVCQHIFFPSSFQCVLDLSWHTQENNFCRLCFWISSQVFGHWWWIVHHYCQFCLWQIVCHFYTWGACGAGAQIAKRYFYIFKHKYTVTLSLYWGTIASECTTEVIISEMLTSLWANIQVKS